MGGRIERALDGVLRLVTRHNKVVLLLLLVAAVAALSAITDLRTGKPKIVLDSSSESMLPANSPERAYYDEFTELFTDNETLMIVLSDGDDFFEADNLERAITITDRVAELPFVERVSSLSTALNIRSEGEDLEISPFIEHVPEGRAELAELRKRALDDPIYAGNLFSRDGKAAVVIAYFMDIPEQELLDARATDQVIAIVDEERGALAAWYSGSAQIKAEFSKIMLRDLTTVIPISWLVMGVIAFLSFRTLRGVIVPVTTVQLSILATMAYVAVYYGKLNAVTVAAPPVLVTVGFAYSIHVLSSYYDVLREWPDDEPTEGRAPEIVFEALRETLIPILFTGVTTAVGFFSLTASPITAVQEFGMFGGIGTLVTMFVSVTFAPALLCVLSVPKVAKIKARAGRVDAAFGRIAEFDVRNRRAVGFAWGAVGIASIIGIFLIDVRTDMMMNFPLDSPARRDFDYVNEHLEGANLFNIALEAKELDSFKEPENLRYLERLQSWLEQQPEVGGTTSIADYVKTINRGFHDVSENKFEVPESRQLVAQLLLIGTNHELELFIDADYEIANLVVRTKAVDSANVMSLVRRVEAHLEATIPAHLKSNVTGNTVLVSATADEIAIGQSVSLAMSFVVIYALLAVQFMSFVSGLLVLLPSALPVLVYFGVLGWSGVTLNTTTALIACIVLGIAVDDTIHLMTHFNRASKRHASEEKGMVEALRVVGRAVTSTTVALGLGFVVLGLSESPTQTSFGLLAAFTIALAWLADVTLTPALASRVRVVNLWDLLVLDLGPDVTKSIPLLSGLTTTQARIVALMTNLETHEAGHALIRDGDEGDQMYVVVDGELDISKRSEDSGETVQLETGTRGTVVGELSMFRGTRTADVTAKTDIRVIRLSKESLAGLASRYPRIASRLYANLSQVIANRLTVTTERIS